MFEIDLGELLPKVARGAQKRLVRLPASLFLGENPVSATLLVPGRADKTQDRLARMKNPNDARSMRRAKVLYDAWLSFYRGNMTVAHEEAIHLFDDIADLEAQTPTADQGQAQHSLDAVLAGLENPAMLQRLGAAYLICCLARYGMKRYYIDAAVAYMKELAASPLRSAQAAAINLSMYEMSIGILSDVPAWIKTGDFGVGRIGSKLLFNEGGVYPENLYAAVLAAVQYQNYQGEYMKSLALIDTAEKVYGMQSVVIGDTYFALYRALNQEALGYSEEANANLKRVVDLVREDGLWQIVAEFIGAFDGRLLAMVEEANPKGAAKCREIAEGFLDRVRQSHEDEKDKRGHQKLTDQEAAVMHLVAAGLLNTEIAEELHIGAETVKFHKRNASQKLGTRPRATAAEVKEALERNQISAEWIS